MCIGTQINWDVASAVGTVAATIVAAVGIIISLHISNREAATSNRQFLFDKRLEKYLLIKDMLELWEKNKITDCDDLIFSPDLDVAFLTNSKRLEDMGRIWNNALDDETKRLFLRKSDDLYKAAIEIKMIWNGRVGEKFSTFVEEYNNLLRAMYGQIVCRESYEKKNKQLSAKDKITLKKINHHLEDEAKKRGLKEALRKLNKTYGEIMDEGLETVIVDTLRLETKE